MKNREKYIKLSLVEFEDELTGNLKYFLTNMEHLGISKMSFPEWYETFGAWLEVNTDMEEVQYSHED